MRTHRIASVSAALALLWVVGAPAALADHSFADVARSHGTPHVTTADRGYGNTGRSTNGPHGGSSDRNHGDARHWHGTPRPVYSDRGHEDGGHWHNAPRTGYTFDHRYGHDRYYPPRGAAVATLPYGYRLVPYRGEHYYFYGGVWYRHAGAYFVVVAPPFGLAVSVLPPFYTTVWVGGAPYYYANGVYYSWRPAEHSYVVNPAPAESGANASAVASASPDRLFIYPKDGQSEQQQANDRYDCHRWAANETSFDPSLPMAGLSPAELGAKRADYDRAMTACLTGRGYTVE